MDKPAQRAHAAANLIAAFELVSRHSTSRLAETRRFGRAVAVRTGIDHPFYNPVLALRGGEDAADVVSAIAWVEGAGVPVSVQVGGPVDDPLVAALGEAGFVANPEPTPVMVLEPIRGAPQPAEGITVRTGGAELSEAWHRAGGWDRGPVVFPTSLMADPTVKLAVGQLDGEDVSQALAIRSGDTIGVYAVITAERARRRGLGTAVTWAVIRAGAEAWGARRAVLQSSEMGYLVYASMGFLEVDRYVEFARPSG